MKQVLIRVNEDNVVTYVNYEPPVDAVEENGYILVPNIGDPLRKEGLIDVLMYSPETKSMYYKYIPRQLTDSERISVLEGVVAMLAEKLAEGGMLS